MLKLFPLHNERKPICKGVFSHFHLQVSTNRVIITHVSLNKSHQHLLASLNRLEFLLLRNRSGRTQFFFLQHLAETQQLQSQWATNLAKFIFVLITFIRFPPRHCTTVSNKRLANRKLTPMK